MHCSVSGLHETPNCSWHPGKQNTHLFHCVLFIPKNNRDRRQNRAARDVTRPVTPCPAEAAPVAGKEVLHVLLSLEACQAFLYAALQDSRSPWTISIPARVLAAPGPQSSADLFIYVTSWLGVHALRRRLYWSLKILHHVSDGSSVIIIYKRQTRPLKHVSGSRIEDESTAASKILGFDGKGQETVARAKSLSSHQLPSQQTLSELLRLERQFKDPHYNYQLKMIADNFCDSSNVVWRCWARIRKWS